ncbi:MurR/RpiR family transcriptional regulator [Inquilinus limosus]|uniref:MurR/RpiR family transcriptional regulator n=1 Tax=Inquilinus limosus TaxID=171674 RepID=UPI0015C6866C|nr:MurR/RpiR family transcriptional regulator [Inquilinus limosus]
MDQDPPQTLTNRLAQSLDALSPAHRRLADFVLQHPFRAATMGIEELAGAAQVSVATANRFAHRLGFGGFPEFRAELLQQFQRALAPVEKLRSAQQAGDAARDLLQRSLDAAAANLGQATALLTDEACADAVDLVLTARRVVPLGLGISAVTARFLAELLQPYCPAVELMDGSGGTERMVRQLLRLGPGDLLVPIAVPRYSRTTIDLLRRAKARGLRALALTDGPTSPLAAESDAALFGPAEHGVLHGSSIAIMALAEALAGAVARRRGTISDAAELTEQIMPFLLVDDAPARRPRPSTPERRR